MNPDNMSYEELVAEVDIAPATWLPGLLFAVIDQCCRQKVFDNPEAMKRAVCDQINNQFALQTDPENAPKRVTIDDLTGTPGGFKKFLEAEAAENAAAEARRQARIRAARERQANNIGDAMMEIYHIGWDQKDPKRLQAYAGLINDLAEGIFNPETMRIEDMIECLGAMVRDHTNLGTRLSNISSKLMLMSVEILDFQKRKCEETNPTTPP